MKVDRNTDFRLVHDRPDGWWERLVWDHEHRTQQERVEVGRRNVAVICGILLVTLFSGWTSFWVHTIGAVGLVFAIGLPLYWWFHVRYPAS